MRLQRRLHGDVIRIVRRLRDRLMELHVGVHAELAVGDAAVERRERAPDLGNVRLLPALGGERGRGAFEADAEFEAALDVGTEPTGTKRRMARSGRRRT